MAAIPRQQFPGDPVVLDVQPDRERPSRAGVGTLGAPVSPLGDLAGQLRGSAGVGGRPGDEGGSRRPQQVLGDQVGELARIRFVKGAVFPGENAIGQHQRPPVVPGGVHGGIDITPGRRGQDSRGQSRPGPDARVGALTPDAGQHRQQVRGRHREIRQLLGQRPAVGKAQVELSPGVPDGTAGLEETVGDASRTGGVTGDSLNVRRGSRCA